MSTCAARRIAHNNQATRQVAIADHSDFTIVFSGIFDLDGCAPENHARVLETESALDQRPQALGRIVSDAHQLSQLRKPQGQAADFALARNRLLLTRSWRSRMSATA
jgi:hypothetical protein